MSLNQEIKDSLWLELLPPMFNSKMIIERDNEAVGNYQNITSVIDNTRKVLSILTKEKDSDIIIEPVSLRTVREFISSINEIVENNLDNFTYPKTKSGYHKAIKNIVENGKLEHVALVYAMDHNTVFEIFKSVRDTMENNRNLKWFEGVEKQMTPKKDISMEIYEAVKKDMPKNNEQKKYDEKHKVQENVNTNDSAVKNTQEKTYSVPASNLKDSSDNKIERKPDFFKKDKETEDEINRLSEELKKTFNQIVQSPNFEGVNREAMIFTMNSAISQSYRDYTNKGNDVDDWFIEVLFKSQYNVIYKGNDNENNNFFSRAYLDIMKDHSKEIVERGLDVERILSDKKIWWNLKVVRENTSTLDYKTFAGTLLPKYLTMRSFTDDERISLGRNITEKVYKDEVNFRTRLNLWLDIGGSLISTNKENKSIVDILQVQKNEMWNNVIISIAKERNVNLHQNYPNEFERKGFYKPTQQDISISRKSSPVY